MTNLETIKKLCVFSPADPVEEMPNHFRVPAFGDGRMMWQGMTIYKYITGAWRAQLDDGRSFLDKDLSTLVKLVLEESAVWA
jgi:hypothetical protein